MESRKAKDLRVRVRRIKVNSSTCSSSTAPIADAVFKSKKTEVTDEMETETPCTSKSTLVPSNRSSPSTSDGDDFATVHFKLAAALEAHLLDWQSMKSALLAEAKLNFKLKSHSNEKTEDNETEPQNSDVEHQDSATEETRLSGVLLKARQDSDSSSTSSSDEDDDVPEILLLSPKPNVDTMDTDRSMLLSKLPFSDPGVSVVDDKNPTAALSKILSLPPFDPHAPHLLVQLIIKNVVSLTQLSQREDNVIEVDIKKSLIAELAVSKKHRTLSPFMDASNIHVKHSNDEFFTFCSCKNCLKYREIVIHIMVEQFKTAHMVVMLLDVLIKAYGPMLKNRTAYNKFEKLLDANKEIYWIACGFVYNKKAEHMDFIYDDSLSDNMIFVLFSSILMVNNPLLLLQILAFHVECIVKAYAEGFIEIVEPDSNKIPAEEMLTYILDGYDDLCRISEQISSYLFAFENDFLRKFNLTWTLLCQRLYQLHVYSNLTDTMLACIITLKEDELTSRHASLIKKYIQFDDKMTCVEKRWADVWNELNKFNLSEAERKRRKCLLNVHRIFDTVVQDAIAFSLQEFDDDNDFYDFQCLENRQLAWQNIMAYTKMKWPDGFFKPPNTLVCEDKCKKCNMLLEYHTENCKCITCSIAGGPLPPRRNSDNTCYKCMAQSLIEKEVNLYESKILNVCTSDDFLSFVRSNSNRKGYTQDDLDDEVSKTLPAVEGKIDDTIELGQYHIAWAVFQHLNNRKRYRYTSIDEKYFCKDCTSPSCLLARKILNNEVTHTLSLNLVQYYQQLSMSIEELRAILPNIMFYNRKMIAFNIGFDLADVHDLVVKIYWTFIISLYARYFMEFDLKCPLNLSYFELENSDIKLCTDKIVGNKDDTKFVKFLDKIKSLSPFKSQVESDFAFTVDVHTEEIQKKLDELLNFDDAQNPALSDQIPPPITNIEATTVVEDHPKKNCKEKMKKCCFDHSDLGDHCKENHSSKKRIKKECNHARMNETRDRLRKKLSQLINARKNMKAAAAAAAAANDPQQPPQPPVLPAQTTTPIASTSTKQPPSLKAVAKAAAAATAANSKTHNFTGNKLEDDDDSLVCLSTLCKRISHLHMNQTASSGQNAQPTTETPNGVGKKVTPAAVIGSSSIPMAKSANAAAWEAANREVTASKMANGKSASGGSEKGGGGSGSRDLSVLSVYLNSYSKEFLDNYSRDQSKVRKWINETLSYIEGGTGACSTNGKKPQPQTTNPKKAAKKAKQKQRKEEEKRIMELQDLRGQFQDIYFKEFTDKHKLKLLKGSKKRDKKQIGELETNIKKLQRAKARVETVILELIATVKQTNAEFKFSYLPTKEQQVEKLKAIEENASGVGTSVSPDANVSSSVPSTIANAIDGINNLNAATGIVPGSSSYALPSAYAHANVPSASFSPYQIDFQSSQSATLGAGAATAGYGMIRAPMPTPMCYAPPPHQTLSPDVVAAMAANAACNSNTDPSKRIVTIRRVNLPNVPEPRVTVTAKGSSPDKDKLLYTFVNGQLVPTSAPPMTQLPLQQLSNVTEPRVTVSAKVNPADKDKLLYSFVNGQLVPTSTPPMTQLPLQQIPLPLPMQAPSPPPPIASSEMPAEHLSLTIPPPPLSKTQLKKERRRAAKLAAEQAAALAAAKEEQLRQEQECARAEKANQQKVNKKSKSKTDEPTQRRTETTTANSKSKNNPGKNAVTPSASTTSVSTAEAVEGVPKKGSKPLISASQRRSASTTTSCSAGTSLSATPVNSQMNTRENSVSSQKPTFGAADKAKNMKMMNKSASQQHKTLIQTEKTIPSQKQKDIVKGQQQTNKGNGSNKKALESECKEKAKSASPEPSETVEKEIEMKKRKKRKKEHTERERLIDNGQFGNNPFATLHTQDSDSDWYSDSSSYDETDSEDDQQTSPVVIVPQKTISNPPVSKSKVALKATTTTTTSVPMASTTTNAAPDVAKPKTKTSGLKTKDEGTSNQQNLRSQNKKGKQEQRKVDGGAKKQQQHQQTVTPPPPSQQQSSQPKQRSATQPQRKNDKDRERERDRDRDTGSSKGKAKGKENVQAGQSSQPTGTVGNRTAGTTSVVGATTHRELPSKSVRQSSRQQKLTENPSQKPMQSQLQTQSQDPPRNRGGRGNRGGGGNGGCSGDGGGNDSRPKRGGGRYERGGRGSGGGNGGTNQNSSRHSADPNHQVSGASASVEGKPLSKRAQRQAQRNKKFQKQQHLHHNYEDCGAGIPNNMGYFNPDEVVIPPDPQPSLQHIQQQQRQYNSLPQQLQALHIGGNLSVKVNGQPPMQPSYASVSNGGNNATYQGMVPALSIMDQLNRGVQVENLSLPPGITLTKVDPVKSEQLRQKSESIRKLSKPLQQQQVQQPQSFHHKAGATIIAPPVAPVGNYFGAAPYAGVAAAAAALEQSGIIMVEANPTSNNNNKKASEKMNAGSGTATGGGKPSKSKKRRNKSKQESNARAANAAASTNGPISGNIGDIAADQKVNGQPKMITLRNPMFHGGAVNAAATILQQQPGLVTGRPLGGLPLAAPIPMDQPAAIIKNENGMFTIRNPALHQAVTNGLALGGYRQFGNVSYYTPQEAAAEAVRATQLQQQQQQQQLNSANQMISTNNNGDGSSASSSSAFSYFSNTSSNASSGNAPASSSSSTGSVGPGTIGSTHNTISISCTSIDENGGSTSLTGSSGCGGGGGLTGDAAIIARPSPQQKCISAIGSEVKNALQQKQKCKEGTTQWPSFVGQELQNTVVPGADNLAAAAAAAAYLGGAGNGCVSNAGNGGVGGGAGGCLTAASLQEKYQQSTYYNGFVDVFPPTAQTSSSQMSTPVVHSANTGSLFDSANDCHLHHHNCGEDSPPPTITGYNSYLDGITNTGVIRYDDASFLKNLIPGQNLSNEVSIHNINDSNFTRSTTSPVAHRVEITPVYRSRPTSTTTNIYEHCPTSAALTQNALSEQQAKYHPTVVPNYNDTLADYGNDAGMFATNNLVNLNELDAGSAGTESDVESYQRYNYEYESQQQQQQQQNAMLDLNELLIKKSSHSPHAQCASPYLDEAAMDSFVQNISTLQISAAADEQCGGHMNGNGNGNSGVGSGGGGNNNGRSSVGAAGIPSNSATTTTANGWW